MATETSKTTGTGISFPTLERSPEQFYPDPVARSSSHETPVAHIKPKAPSDFGRIPAALGRWVLIIVLVLVAPVGLIAWTVTGQCRHVKSLATPQPKS